jgi:hypothetical protein
MSGMKPATAGTPPADAANALRVVDANGFTAAGVRPAGGEAVVGTFRSNDATVRIVARRGTSVSFHPSLPATGRPGTLRMSMAATRPKTARDASAYRDAGRSIIDDLVALGMPRQQAIRQFGELAGVSSQPADEAPAPYDTQCASINVADGKISGYGCAAFFLVHRDGPDWG